MGYVNDVRLSGGCDPVGGRALEDAYRCNYCYYMKSTELKVARIGNSRGVRIPATTLARYRIGESVVMEERPEGILLRPRAAATPKLSWEDTANAMAAEAEDWSDWEHISADGLGELAWSPSSTRRVAEPGREFQVVRRIKAGVPKK